MKKKMNATLAAIVNILNDGQFHDGDSIGASLTITRSAVWKAIKKLMNYGVQIESVKGKGYALLEPLMLLDPVVIQKQIDVAPVEIAFFESIPSTNDYLRSHKPPAISICIAEQQTQGKGRFNRKWHSPFGENIYLSCLYPFHKDISELAGLSLVTSLAVNAALRECVHANDLAVKWPNDIVYEGKKLAGSLIEIQAETHGACQAIIGMGVNVNMRSDDGEITQPWTSLRQISGDYVDRNVVCVSLINHLLRYLAAFNDRGFAPFVAEWMRKDCLMQREIRISNLNEQLAGTVVGINEQGHLLLQTTKDTIRTISSGDASIAR